MIDADAGDAITVRELSVDYGGRPAVQGVSFVARYGEVLAILGPNGAGKSTLLRATAGLVSSRGEVRYGGRALSAVPRMERARFAAYVPQRSTLNANLRVRSVVEQGRHPHRGPLSPLGARDHEAVERALAATRVATLQDRSFTELSGGEQRRVLLARALATEARVILLDEPTESLDVAHTLELHALLSALAAEGRAIVSVMHGLDDARRHTHRALLLSGGKLVTEGTSAQVVAEEPVRAVYSVELVEAAALGFRRLGEAT